MSPVAGGYALSGDLAKENGGRLLAALRNLQKPSKPLVLLSLAAVGPWLVLDNGNLKVTKNPSNAR